MPSPFLTPYVPQQYDRGPTMRIVDLLQQGGDARARALLQKSQLWGQAIQQLGQIPQQIMEGRAAERESKARADERQAQTDLRRRQMAAMEAEQGRRQQLTETLGSGRARGEILKALEADPEAYKLATEHFGRVDSGRNRWMGEIAAGVRAFKDDPQAALAALADAEEQGYDPRRLEPLRQQIQQNPAAVSEIVDSLLMQSPDETHRAMVRKPAKLEEVSPGASLYDPSKGEAVFTAPVVEKPPASLDAAKAAAYAAGDMTKVEEITRLQAQEAAATRAPQRPQYSAKTVMLNGEEKQVNYDETTGKYYDMDTGAVLSNVAPAPTADMRNKKEGRKLVSKSINAIKDLSTQIITKVGPAQRADAIKRGAEAVFGFDPEFRTYQDARTALAGNLAVAQQGSRPSDADIKAIWLPLVPDAYRDTSESARLKWELIETMSNVAKDSNESEDLTPEESAVLKKYLPDGR